MTQEEVEKFKKRVLDMNRGVPSYYYYGLLEKDISNPEIRNYFIEKDVFVKSANKNEQGQDLYFLGVNGINLANSYNMEKLTNENRDLNLKIKRMTKWLIGLTITYVIFTIIQTILTFFTIF